MKSYFIQGDTSLPIVANELAVHVNDFMGSLLLDVPIEKQMTTRTLFNYLIRISAPNKHYRRNQLEWEVFKAFSELPVVDDLWKHIETLDNKALPDTKATGRVSPVSTGEPNPRLAGEGRPVSTGAPDPTKPIGREWGEQVVQWQETASLI